MPFEFQELELKGLILIKPKVFGDERGFFMETYKQTDFKKAGIANPFVQGNHSRSTKGVLRGIHFQKGASAQGKLVRCTRGEIYDVAVDLRRNSPTYGKWKGVALSEENKRLLFVPRGFGHSFYTVSEVAEVEYLADNLYDAASEGGVIWNDPDLNIGWPLEGGQPQVSEKDSKWPRFRELGDL